ncbi:unnamed protein product [Prunus brigantina]
MRKGVGDDCWTKGAGPCSGRKLVGVQDRNGAVFEGSGGVSTRQVGGEPRMPGSGSTGAQTNRGAVEDTRLAYESHPGGCISLMWKMWNEEKEIPIWCCCAAVRWGTSTRTSTLSVGENVTGRI